MARTRPIPKNNEIFFSDDEIIVSKTDLRGTITYANDVFLAVSGYPEEEILGSPHSIIRHPDMPRAIFKLLWEVLQEGQELFGYIKNLCKDGSYYWVYAHITPTFDEGGRIIGYHSNRRTPDREALQKIENMYQLLLAEERKYADPRKGLQASYQLMSELLQEEQKPYEEYVWSLSAAV